MSETKTEIVEESPTVSDAPPRSTSTAKKSTTQTPDLPTRYTSSRLAALAIKNKLHDNCNPDTSSREKRKLDKALKTKTPVGAVYDSKGRHIATGLSLCDCLDSKCAGCFFPCKKCFSPKCGPDCRNNRRIVYKSADLHGFSYHGLVDNGYTSITYNLVEKVIQVKNTL